MARLQRRQEAVDTALQGGRRTRRDVVLLLRRVAVVLGRGAIDALLLGPLRRALRSRSARKRSVAAQGARGAWRDVHPEPARDRLLRRAVARAGGAIQFVLAPGRRALADVHNLLQRVLGVRRYFRQYGLFLEFRLLLLRLRPRPRQGQPQLQPPPPPRAFAALYGALGRRRRAPAPASPTPTPPPSPPQREPQTVDGEIVPDEEVIEYANYCKAARVCPENSTLCHLCCFYMQRSRDCTVPTNDMIRHCNYYHKEKAVFCGKFGCMVKAPSGRDMARHTHFCHTLPTDWWQKYV